MAPRPKNRPPDRRQEILDAALELFAQRGFESTTNTDIAKEVGITSAALYYYFPSKEALFKAAVSERHASMAPSMRDLIETGGATDPGGTLGAIVGRFIAFLTEPRTHAVLKVILSEGPRHPELIRVWQDHVMGGAAETILSFVRREMQAGRIRKLDPRILFMLLNGPILATVMTRDILRVPAMQGVSNEELARQICDVILAGLAPRE